MDINPMAQNEDIDNSSQTTEEVSKSFDSESMIDPPEEKVGDTKDITYDGKVVKEILEVGEGVKRPKRNYIAKVSYKAYFFDHTEFYSTNDEVIDLILGDIQYPEGLWKGIEEMRKNEKAKIKIKKKYGFGRQENVDKLKFPKGYEEEESENRKRLMTKGIIYEVKLIDWIEREDVEADGNFIKTYQQKAQKKQWETPSDKDEVVLDIKVFQKVDQVLIEKNEYEISMDDQFLTPALSKVVGSLKRDEFSTTMVKIDYVKENDQQLLERLSDKLDINNDIFVQCHLKKLIKVEDWFKDNTTIKRVLRKVRLRVQVNDQVILNNYKEERNFEDQEDQTQMLEDQKKSLLQDSSIFTIKLEDYKLPSLLIKVIKSMKINEVCELKTSRIDKLHTNFNGDLFDQYSKFKEGDKVSFIITMVKFENMQYFYKLKVAEKLERVLYLKNIAGQFFKKGDYRKAAKLYQKINGYYNFGDATNNQANEDENAEEFKIKNEQLLSMKVTCFVNLVVCKHKMKEYESIIGITDQIIDMDPKNTKALYYRGKAFIETQEYDKAVKCLSELVQIIPDNKVARDEYVRARHTRKNFIEKQQKAFSKMFN